MKPGIIRIKLLLLLLLSILFSGKIFADSFSDKYGSGLIIVNGKWDLNGEYRAAYLIELYDSINDQAEPVKKYFCDWNSTDSERLEMELDLNYKHFDYGFLIMVCLEQKGKWFKIRIKEDKEFWIKNFKFINGWKSENNYEFISWEKFISRAIWVIRKDILHNPIRKKSNAQSEVIVFDAPECLHAMEVKGFWVKVEPKWRRLF